MINVVRELLRNLCGKVITIERGGNHVLSDIIELMPSVRRMEIAFP